MDGTLGLILLRKWRVLWTLAGTCVLAAAQPTEVRTKSELEASRSITAQTAAPSVTIAQVQSPSVVAPSPGEPRRAGLPLDGTYERMMLTAWATQWIDPSGKAAAADALTAARSGRFARATETPSLLHPHAALWYRLEVQQRGRVGDWYIRNNSPTVDQVSVHWRASDGSWRSEVAGDQIATANWPQRHRLPLFALPIDVAVEPDGIFELWIRVQHARMPFFSPIEIVNQQRLRWVSELGYWLFGLFYGMVVVALAICAQQIATFRDRAFVAYAGITVSMALLQGVSTGLLGQFVLPSSPAINDQLSFTAAEIYTLCALYFTYSACSLERYLPRVAWGFKAWMGLGVVLILAHIALPTRLLFVLSNIYMPLSMVAAITATVLAHRRGERWAKWILVGVTPVVLAACLPIARNYGFIGTGFWTQYGLMLAASMKLIILMVVLIRRSHELHESKIRARALMVTDALTGVTHERLFLERLHGSVVRARRYGHQSGLLFVTLVNYGWFRKEHGQQVAERALVLAASRIRAVARDVDTVARVAENEFVLLVEGPVNAASMVNTATKVLARSLQPAEALPIGTQLKYSITMAMLPDTPGTRIEEETEAGLSAQSRLQWLREMAAARLAEPNAKTIGAINF